MADLVELVDRYMEEHKLWNMEGPSGVRRFETFLTALGGYGHEGFSDTLREFLQDNPGAINAIIEWIGTLHVKEWEENLIACVEPFDSNDE